MSEALTPYQICIFDFDGTLANTPPYIIETATKVLREFGLEPERLKDVPQLVGPPFPQAFSEVFGYSKEEAQAITSRYREIYTKLGRSAWPPFPGIPELLADLQNAGRILAVASSKRKTLLQKSLADWHLDPFFTYVMGQNETSTHPKAQSIAEIVSTHPDLSACMIGDRKYDVAAAHTAHIPTIGVTYGHTCDPQELRDAGAYLIVDSLGALRHVLAI